MSELKNDRFLKALMREPVDQTPIWMMRQAGRYLPEYRATRAQAGDFMSLCKNTELACEVTMQPLERYPFDAAILFSDILTIPDAMGLGLHFVTGEGPRFHKPVQDAKAIEALEVIDTAKDLTYVTDAVSRIRQELNGRVPLIGFSGSPWTLATYMVEGGPSKDFARIKSMVYGDSAPLHLLLDKLADSVIDYLNAQIEAGAQAVQIFDTWGGALSHKAYTEFSLNYMSKIVAKLHKSWLGHRIPVIVFTKGGGQWLETIATSGADAVGLDWTTSIDEARKRVGHKVSLQGNMDPAVLNGSDNAIRTEVRRILDDFGNHPGHVFNLGHGITPGINPEKVGVFVEEVQSYSRKLRGE